MTQTWFDPNLYAWIPGTAYGLIATLLGGLVAWLAPQARARKLVLSAWFLTWAVAVALLLTGIVAIASGQPWGVWFGLLLPGVIGTLVVGATTAATLRCYREVEERRLSAKDFLS